MHRWYLLFIVVMPLSACQQRPLSDAEWAQRIAQNAPSVPVSPPVPPSGPSLPAVSPATNDQSAVAGVAADPSTIGSMPAKEDAPPAGPQPAAVATLPSSGSEAPPPAPLPTRPDAEPNPVAAPDTPAPQRPLTATAPRPAVTTPRRPADRDVRPPQSTAATSAPLSSDTSSSDRRSDEVTNLIRRGDALLALGDISAARRLYDLAARAGSGRAAMEAGKTYDPEFLRDAGVRGIQPNESTAISWYRKAVELGDPQAETLLRRLQH